ncbi:putative DNA repair ATPase SbcC [Tetraselmis virus 1]|uniref:Putative DNA repair ATPase SbcC n=1 Tax=Tetraselmis virus 1 TaxID=2060617 RepID=A0A2P0VPB8_9VIRU|nr:putative DNA repair ATPase SbcC [Tetraselmis virus 1]AUF82744.1 putative DNA repair ATPase SbcC [Tetraselmis virus 1]
MEDYFSTEHLSSYVHENLLNSISSEQIEQCMRWLRGDDLCLITNNEASSVVDISDRNKKIQHFIDKHNEITDRIETEDLKLLKIEWQWILCYGAHNLFDFTNKSNNICILAGENGTGKTAFLETIVLGLFGCDVPSKLSKGNPTCIVNTRKPKDMNAYTMITIKVGNKSYRIRREFTCKSDKISQIVSIIDNESDELVETKKMECDKWIIKNIGTIDAFLLKCMITQQNDMDFVSMDKKKQQQFVDEAIRPREDLLYAISESKKAHKWAIGLYKSFLDNIVFEDVDDETLLSEMNELKRLKRAKILGKVQMIFIKSHKSKSNKKRKDIARINYLMNKYPDIDDWMEEDVIYDGNLEYDTKRAKADIDNWKLKEPIGTKPDTQGDNVTNLEQRVQKYKECMELMSRSNDGPFCESCWACNERKISCGQVHTETRLKELGVTPDLSIITKKLRGYEKRLESCRRAIVFERWTEEYEKRQQIYDDSLEKYQRQTELTEKTELRTLLELYGKWSNGTVDDRFSQAIETIKHIKRNYNEKAQTVYKLKYIRECANKQRAKVRHVKLTREETSLRYELLEKVNNIVTQYYKDIYEKILTGSISRYVEETLYPLMECKLKTDWTGQGFSFFFGKDERPIEKACGFERAAFGVAIRIAIASLGIGSVKCKQLFFDECFSSFDDCNTSKLPSLFENLTKKGNDIMIVTHNDVLKKSNYINIDISIEDSDSKIFC